MRLLRTLSILLACLLPAAMLGCGDAEAPTLASVEVEVERIGYDPVSETPVVILRESAGERRLPIWIGMAEARSIAIEIDRVRLPRPNAHDLTKRVLVGLDATIARVVVTELRDGVYFAAMLLTAPSGAVEIDSRPSDAIAVALRAGAPVFVRETLFEEAGASDDADDDFPSEPGEERLTL